MLLSTSMLGVSWAQGTAAAQDGPRDAIELYFQAHAFGDGDYIRRAFADDAKIEFVEKKRIALGVLGPGGKSGCDGSDTNDPSLRPLVQNASVR
jgi:hypothetical protein